MTKTLTGTYAALAAALLACTAASGLAQDYPIKPIRYIVPFAAGGMTDILGRIFGAKLSEAWGQQVIVDNRPGANQTIAADMTAKAAPDGYTIVIVAAGHAISPALYKLPYDALKDFSAIGMVAMVPNVLVVHPALPARSVREFIAYAGARPGALNFGSSGVGSASHLTAELFQMMARVKLVHVPFKGQGLA